MSILILDSDNRTQISRTLIDGGWVVACLCAAWCDSCREYLTNFTNLAQRHPHIQFVWIDIEDQADLVGDLDIDNFPTLLIQHGNIVTFLGPVKMDSHLAERIFLAQIAKTPSELQAQANYSNEQRNWQQHANLLL